MLPYLQAVRQHGSDFAALLWASPRTQRLRFNAIARILDLQARSVLDAGCGRADLMGYLLEKDIHPADYIGLEAVESLAAAAEAREYPNSRIVRGDFVQDPARLFVGADVIVFSGSLNTMDTNAFYTSLQRAYDAAGEAVVFNFLCSPSLAGKDYLVWRRPEQVLDFCRRTADRVGVLDDYLPGDCSIAMIKAPSHDTPT